MGRFSGAVTFGITTDRGTATVPAVERELTTLIPLHVHSASTRSRRWRRRPIAALKPISIALAVFGAVALLATLLIGTQVIGRRFRSEAGDLGILRALGAGSGRHPP